MNFFVTNDDGIDSPGIKVLVEELSKYGDVYLVAPDKERSASSHSVTIRGSLYLEKKKYENTSFAYACSGTPVDCVKVGLDFLKTKKIKIDMLFSGINHGRNLGIDTLYSGTVAAAKEGMINNIPSFALSIAGKFSTKGNEDLYFDYPRLLINKLCKLKKKSIKNYLLLNINFPNLPSGKIKGHKFTKLHNYGYNEWFKNTADKNGHLTFNFTGVPQYKKSNTVNDVNLLNKNYVTITPLAYIKNDDRDFSEIEKDLKNL